MASYSEPFRGLDALRAANDALFGSLPDRTSGAPETGTPPTKEQIEEFVRRAVETGALLDSATDRRAAQGLIDYWAGSRYTGNDRLEISGLKSILLKPFDGSLADAACARGDEALSKLRPNEQEVARRILLRLFDIDEEAKHYWSSSTLIEGLYKTGQKPQVHAILDSLTKAQVVSTTITDRGPTVELKYDFLLRRWATLRRLVDQRLKFREAALLWLSSGEKRSMLLGASQCHEAGSYDDLTQNEREFIKRSRSRSHFYWLATGAAAIALLALIPVTRPIFDRVAKEYFNAYRSPELEKLLRSDDASIKDKEDAFRSLVANGKLSFSTMVLVDLNLSRLYSAAGLSFVHASLSGVAFNNAVLPFADFSSSRIRGGKFNDATLNGARFSDAQLVETKFTGADLVRTIFDRARLCAGVDFGDARLRNASFRDVLFDDDKVPNFRGSAWWTAVGWTAKQRAQLAKQSEGVERSDSGAFKKDIRDADEDLLREPGSGILRADALNDKAWKLAIWGLQLKEAETAARESLRIIEAMPPNPQIDISKAAASDTLAYVLMQNGRMKEALPYQEFAVTQADAEGVDFGGVIFRYALTQFALGQQGAKASLQRALNAKKYIPSHELHLLGISDEVRNEVEEMTRSNAPQVKGMPLTANAPSPCSSLPQAVDKPRP